MATLTRVGIGSEFVLDYEGSVWPRSHLLVEKMCKLGFCGSTADIPALTQIHQ